MVVKYQIKLNMFLPGRVFTVRAYATSAVSRRLPTTTIRVADTEIRREGAILSSLNALA